MDERSRYALTPWGEQLAEPLHALARWGAPLMDEMEDSETFRSEWLDFPVAFIFGGTDPDRPPLTVEIRAGGSPVTMESAGGEVHLPRDPLYRLTSCSADRLRWWWDCCPDDSTRSRLRISAPAFSAICALFRALADPIGSADRGCRATEPGEALSGKRSQSLLNLPWQFHDPDSANGLPDRSDAPDEVWNVPLDEPLLTTLPVTVTGPPTVSSLPPK